MESSGREGMGEGLNAGGNMHSQGSAVAADDKAEGRRTVDRTGFYIFTAI